MDVPNKLVRLASKTLSKPFAYIFNKSISTGIVPDVFKVSRVTPVFKSGTLSDPSNYRPIATLSSFSKALERVIYDQLIQYLDKHDVLFKYQFGFRKNHSTEQAIMEITDNLKASIDSNLVSCGLFLDFSKAFDTVNHQILLDKLCKYGVRGGPHDWFASYLQDRKQFVQIGNDKSSLLEMTCGVPQGSTLRPLLFLIYINDIANSSNKLSFRLFADDANIFYTSDDINDIESVMNCEMTRVLNYCSINKLSVNMKKTNFMLITSSRKKVTPINILNFEQKACIKYLGVYIDQHLNWKDQITHVKNIMVSKNIGILYKLRHYVSIHVLKQLYFTLIYPYLNYAVVVWGNTYPSNLNKLCTPQNKCIRCMFFTDSRESSQVFYKLLGILKFDNIVKLSTCVLAHKIFNKSSNIPSLFHDSLGTVSCLHKYNTRYASKGNFHRPKVRTNTGKFTFVYAASKLWETVPTNLKRLSINNFKKRYKNHLLKCQS